MIVKCIKHYIGKLIVISLTLFFASLVTVKSIFLIIRDRSKFFQVKRRDVPPDCLNDSALGIHYFVQLSEVKLHYVANGDSDRPLMLLVHGFPEFWFSWRNQLKRFAKEYYVVAVDLRGYGESDKPLSIASYTVDKLSQDIKELIKALNKDKAILVGHDWGGAVAYDVAVRYPSVIDRLIILNAPYAPVFAEVRNKNWKQFLKSWYMLFFNCPFIPELYILSNDLILLEELFKSADKRDLCTEEEINAYKYTFSRPNAITCALNIYRAAIRRYPMTPKSSLQIRVRTLVIWGKKDMALLPVLANCGKYCNELTIRYIDNCSHWTPMEQPLVVNQYIADFLK